MIPEALVQVKSKGANMGGFVPLLYSLMTDYTNQGRRLRTVVEIGVRWGTSTLSFLHGIKDRGRKDPRTQLYSIDINDCSKVVKDKELKKYWTFIQGDSKEIAKTWDKGDIDILLIDGDHSFEGVQMDFKLWEPYVKERGIILMHDVLWPHKGVTKFFWDEVWYPKSVLSLSKSGMGIIYKLIGKPYKESKIRYNDKNIAQGR